MSPSLTLGCCPGRLLSSSPILSSSGHPRCQGTTLTSQQTSRPTCHLSIGAERGEQASGNRERCSLQHSPQRERRHCWAGPLPPRDTRQDHGPRWRLQHYMSSKQQTGQCDPLGRGQCLVVTLLSPLLICLGDQLQRQRSQGLGQWASGPAYPGGTCGDAQGAQLTALPAQGLLLPERKGLSPLLTLQSPLGEGTRG